MKSLISKTLVLMMSLTLITSCGNVLDATGLKSAGESQGGSIYSGSVFGASSMDAIIAELEALEAAQSLTTCQAIDSYVSGDAALKSEIMTELQITCS